MLLCVSCATISEFASLGRLDFSHLGNGNFDRKSAYRRTVAVPSYVRFEGLPLDEQENLHHWYCDRCLAVYESLRPGREDGTVRKGILNRVLASKTEKLIELVRNSGETEQIKQSDMLNQQLPNRSEGRGRASSDLKHCLVNVFQRLTIESSPSKKTRRQSFNATKYQNESPHGIDAVARKFSPTKAFGGKGPRLYKQPATKSNRGIILNAVEYCVFPGAVNRDAKQKVLEKIARSEAKHFLVLFRDAGCQFRALYGYWPENEQIIKLYGTGPSQVDDVMFDKFFKYNSGGKCFTQVHTKHLTVTIDAFTIHNSLWQGKKANLPSKKDMALVI